MTLKLHLKNRTGKLDYIILLYFSANSTKINQKIRLWLWIIGQFQQLSHPFPSDFSKSFEHLSLQAWKINDTFLYIIYTSIKIALFFVFFQTRGNLTSLLWLLRLFQNIRYFLRAWFQCIYFKQQVIGAYNNMRQFSQSLWSAGSDKKTQARLCKSITSHIPLRHYFGYGPFKRPRVKPSILKGEPGPVRVVGRPFNSPLDIYWQ